HASSLCGACADACPVRIDIPRMLIELRREVDETKIAPRTERAVFKAFGRPLTCPVLYRLAARITRLLRRPFARHAPIRTLRPAERGEPPGVFPATPATGPEDPREEAEAIRAQLAERWPEALERFRREFEKVGGVFHRVPTLTEVPQVVTGIARAREARRLVSWHPSQLGADLGQALAARGLTPLPMPPGEATNPTERARLRQLVASAELGLTGVDLAIAETGTLVL